MHIFFPRYSAYRWACFECMWYTANRLSPSCSPANVLLLSFGNSTVVAAQRNKLPDIADIFVVIGVIWYWRSAAVTHAVWNRWSVTEKMSETTNMRVNNFTGQVTIKTTIILTTKGTNSNFQSKHDSADIYSYYGSGNTSFSGSGNFDQNQNNDKNISISNNSWKTLE